jgi:hypothetical protein
VEPGNIPSETVEHCIAKYCHSGEVSSLELCHKTYLPKNAITTTL